MVETWVERKNPFSRRRGNPLKRGQGKRGENGRLRGNRVMDAIETWRKKRDRGETDLLLRFLNRRKIVKSRTEGLGKRENQLRRRLLRATTILLPKKRDNRKEERE